MSTKYKKFRLLAFLPALLIMLMIFFFSSEDSDDSTSTSQGFTKSVISLVDSSFQLELSDTQLEAAVERFEHFVRKLAHFTEYMVLGLSIIYPIYLFYESSFFKLVILPELFCLIYASTDEFHQLFIPGRAASIIDVLIDSMGSLFGLLLCFYILLVCKKIDIHGIKK